MATNPHVFITLDMNCTFSTTGRRSSRAGRFRGTAAQYWVRRVPCMRPAVLPPAVCTARLPTHLHRCIPLHRRARAHGSWPVLCMNLHHWSNSIAGGFRTFATDATFRPLQLSMFFSLSLLEESCTCSRTKRIVCRTVALYNLHTLWDHGALKTDFHFPKHLFG